VIGEQRHPVHLKNVIFSDVTLCGSYYNEHFGERQVSCMLNNRQPIWMAATHTSMTIFMNIIEINKNINAQNVKLVSASHQHNMD
jgi:hypothetical protein